MNDPVLIDLLKQGDYTLGDFMVGLNSSVAKFGMNVKVGSAFLTKEKCGIEYTYDNLYRTLEFPITVLQNNIEDVHLNFIESIEAEKTKRLEAQDKKKNARR